MSCLNGYFLQVVNAQRYQEHGKGDYIITPQLHVCVCMCVYTVCVCVWVWDMGVYVCVCVTNTLPPQLRSSTLGDVDWEAALC